MVARVPALLAGDTGSIPGGIRNFNFYPETGCVSFVCDLYCIVSGGGPDHTTHSHVKSVLLSLSSNRPYFIKTITNLPVSLYQSLPYVICVFCITNKYYFYSFHIYEIIFINILQFMNLLL